MNISRRGALKVAALGAAAATGVRKAEARERLVPPEDATGMLYDSIQKIFALPADTRLFMCHDYKAPGRDEFEWETSVAEQRQSNVHINGRVSRDEFIAMREGRDAELGMPKLLLPSIQVNVRAGQLPEPESNRVRYLKIPLDIL